MTTDGIVGLRGAKINGGTRHLSSICFVQDKHMFDARIRTVKNILATTDCNL